MVVLIGTAVIMLCFAVALWRGGFYERFVTGLIAAGTMLTLFLGSMGHNPTVAVAVLDFAVFGLLFYASYTSRKVWVFIAATCQLLTAAAHVAVFLAVHIEKMGHFATLNIWGGYGLVAAMIGGLIANEVTRARQDAAQAGAGG